MQLRIRKLGDFTQPKKDALKSSTIAGWWPKEARPSLEKLVTELRPSKSSSRCHAVGDPVQYRSGLLETLHLFHTQTQENEDPELHEGQCLTSALGTKAGTLKQCLHVQTTNKMVLKYSEL